MKRQDLIKALEAELKRTYHNATLTNKLTCDSDYECDLVQSQVELECGLAIDDLKETCPGILQFGEVFQYGRGGRTVAPKDIIQNTGGGGFRIKTVDELDLDDERLEILLTHLKEFNDHVKSFCSHVTDSAIEFIREEYKTEIEANKNKKRQHFSGVRYI